MLRFIFLAVVSAVASGWLVAAPVPQQAAALVTGLSDASMKVRDESAAALRGRADALPWLRRAARSADKDTAKRAASLLAPYEPKRQAAVAKAIDACIRDGRADLFMMWHHYWQPENKDDLLPVGPRMAQAGEDEYIRCGPPDAMKLVEELRNGETRFKLKPRSHDGSLAQMPRKRVPSAAWSIRTDQWWNPPHGLYVTFASVAGSAWLDVPSGQRFFVLGPVQATPRMVAPFVVCDGEFYSGFSGYAEHFTNWGSTSNSFVVCRGNFRGGGVGASVLLVDGDVDLFDWGGCKIQDSLIRASGEIRIPKNATVVNSTLVPHAKNATVPYKFFELADVGLSLVDDEEGLVVADVQPNTPFGNCGLMKGDIIQAIDDARAGGHSSEFRRKVRKAMVVQGDCLLTVARGNTTLDLAVFFPFPK